MVSSQINNSALLFQNIEANLEGLRGRLPDLPTASVMLSRILMLLGRGMSAMLEHEIRPFGLNEMEFRALTTLFAQPDGVAHPTDLCAKTSQSPANMSRISDALLRRDLITRMPSVRDRRKMVLHITGEGEALVRRLLPLLYAPLRDMFQDMSEEDQRALIALLKRLSARLDQAMAHCAPERKA